jgi:hypothetical protein
MKRIIYLAALACALAAACVGQQLEVPATGSTNWNVPMDYDLNELNAIINGTVAMPSGFWSGNTIPQVTAETTRAEAVEATKQTTDSKCTPDGSGDLNCKTIAAGTTTPTHISDAGVTFPDGSVQASASAGLQTAFDIRSYGAKVDGKAVGEGYALGSTVTSDCWTTAGSTTLQCTTAHFAASDVGKVILVEGAGPSYVNWEGGNVGDQTLRSTIAAYVSGTQITLADAASTTMGSSPVTISNTAIDTTSTNYGNTIITCATACGVSQHELIVFQNPISSRGVEDAWDLLTSVGSVTDSTHFVISTPYDIDPTYPLTSAILETRSPRVTWGTDDTVAIQAAMDAAAANGGGTVFFPPGITLATTVQLPCSLTSVSGCTLAYNNINIEGAGRRVSVLEGIWTSNPYTSLLNIGSKAGAPGNGNDWLRGIKVHEMTVRQPLYFATSEVPVFTLAATYNAEIYNLDISGASAECFYEMGNYGHRVHDNHVGPCGLSAYNLCGENGDVYNNTATRSDYCSEYGEVNSKFRGNECSYNPRGITVGSTVAGVWGDTISDNRMHNSAGIGITNGNGVVCDMKVLHNEANEGGFSFQSSLDYNKLVSARVNAQSCPTGHGISIIQGNTFEGDITTTGFSLGGPESFIFQDNTFTQKTSRCSAGTNWGKLCTADSDCPSSYCGSTPASYIYESAGSGPQTTVWKPSISYAGLTDAESSDGTNETYVIPSLPNGFMYGALGASGTGSTAEPTWCTTIGCTVTDGAVTLTNMGPEMSFTIKNLSISASANVSTASSSNPILQWTAYRHQIHSENVTVFPSLQIYECEIGTPGNCFNEPAYGKVGRGQVYGDSNRWWGVWQDLAYSWVSTPPFFGKWSTGEHVSTTDATAVAQGFIVTSDGWSAMPWLASQSCAYGTFVVPTTYNAFVYEATNVTTGTTGTTEPTWPATLSNTVTDGTCTWTAITAAARFTKLPISSATTSTPGVVMVPAMWRAQGAGSGTYYTPSNATMIHVRVYAPGGGGEGSGSGDYSYATTTSGDSTFGPFTARGDASGGYGSGPGGTSTVGTSFTASRTIGSCPSNVATVGAIGGNGASGLLGGGGAGGAANKDTGFAASGGNATAPGAGGGGAGGDLTNAVKPGCGGDAGSYVEGWMFPPLASYYTYSIGASGTGGVAGTNGYAGGAGGDGMIVVESY